MSKDYVRKAVGNKIEDIVDEVRKLVKQDVIDEYREDKQDDPDKICGNIWWNGTPSQREAFGNGPEGRNPDDDERAPEEWWEDCTREVENQEG